MLLKSPAFQSGETIPTKFTCDGENVSPPLVWGDIPEGTAALLLVCDDPDAPSGVFHHWIAYNIPPERGELPEGFGPEALADGIEQAVNDFDRPGYGGPCPPQGDKPHAYHFRLSALSSRIEVADPSADWAEIDKLARPNVIEEVEFVAYYGR